MIPKIPKHRTTKTPGSSNVSEISHNPVTGDLDVTFHGNRKYRYHDVSADKASQLKTSKSQGSFLNQHILDKHDCTKLC